MKSQAGLTILFSLKFKRVFLFLCLLLTVSFPIYGLSGNLSDEYLNHLSVEHFIRNNDRKVKVAIDSMFSTRTINLSDTLVLILCKDNERVSLRLFDSAYLSQDANNNSQDSNKEQKSNLITSYEAKLLKEWDIRFLKFIARNRRVLHDPDVSYIYTQIIIKSDTTLFESLHCDPLSFPSDSITALELRNSYENFCIQLDRYISEKELYEKQSQESPIRRFINWLSHLWQVVKSWFGM